MYTIKVLDKITNKGLGIVNEDSLCYSETQAIVIDGSTSIIPIKVGKFKTQTQFLVDFFLTKYILKDKERISKNSIKVIEKFREMEKSLNLEDFNEPSATIASICLTDSNTILLELLGDCSISVLFKNGEVKTFKDRKIEKYEQKTKEVVSNTILEDKERARQIQMSENIKNLNKDGGFYKLSTIGSFSNQFLAEELCVDDVDKILLYTDGFERLFNIIGSYVEKLREVLNQENTLEYFLKELRNKEKEIITNNVKQHDDVAVILLKIEK